jgi:hypothetical protein
LPKDPGAFRVGQLLPQSPPALGKEPACGGVEQAPGEHCAGGEEQAYGLVAMEGAPLGIAAGDALLLDGIVFHLVHTNTQAIRSVDRLAEV